MSQATPYGGLIQRGDADALAERICHELYEDFDWESSEVWVYQSGAHRESPESPLMPVYDVAVRLRLSVGSERDWENMRRWLALFGQSTPPATPQEQSQ